MKSKDIITIQVRSGLVQECKNVLFCPWRWFQGCLLYNNLLNFTFIFYGFFCGSAIFYISQEERFKKELKCVLLRRHLSLMREVLDWPRSSFGFFFNILWKNLNFLANPRKEGVRTLDCHPHDLSNPWLEWTTGQICCLLGYEPSESMMGPEPLGKGLNLSFMQKMRDELEMICIVLTLLLWIISVNFSLGESCNFLLTSIERIKLSSDPKEKTPLFSAGPQISSITLKSVTASLVIILHAC